MDIESLGFKIGNNESGGRTKFDPRDLLKLYAYGYLNGIKTSRKSAKQPNFNLAYSCLKNEIVDEFRRHEYILESPSLKNEKEEYEKIVHKEGDT
jgi:transposase